MMYNIRKSNVYFLDYRQKVLSEISVTHHKPEFGLGQ